MAKKQHMGGNNIKIMRIYIPQNKVQVLKESITKEVTFFEFFRDIKKFLKELLEDPFNAEVTGVLKENGIDKNDLKNTLLNRGVIKKKEKIDEPYDEVSKKKKSMFHVTYNIPKKNFERKIQRLYTYYFE